MQLDVVVVGELGQRKGTFELPYSFVLTNRQRGIIEARDAADSKDFWLDKVLGLGSSTGRTFWHKKFLLLALATVRFGLRARDVE